MKQRAGTEVVRLIGAGPDGSDVIAKSCSFADAEREEIIYERILAEVPLPTLRYYGRLDAGPVAWLFVEAACGEPFAANARAHRELAGRWLAALHEARPGPGVAQRLPARDAIYYRNVVVDARAALTRAGANPAVPGRDASVVRRLIAHASRLLDTWSAQAEALASLPAAVVHNDFWKGNVRVRSGPGGLTLLPFDWGAAGWGSPAVDLAAADLHAYRSARDMSRPTSTRCPPGAVATGAALRVLGAIPGEADTLASEWPHRGLRKLRAYLANLDDVAYPCRA